MRRPALSRSCTLTITVEQIGAKVGKSPAYVAARARLAQLAPTVTEAFAKDEIGVGHALLLAKLQSAEQEQALAACYQDTYTNGSKPKRILLPVRHLQQWIEHNILLELATAPFSKDDAQLVPEAGSCVECPKRTGHNTLLFADIGTNQPDSCSDPKCYAAKIDAHVKQTVAAKPKLVQISSAYGKPAEGSPVIPRNKYVEIRQEKPKNKNERDWPEYKTCKYTAEAIVTEGTEKGETKKVCANPECPVHHPKRQQAAQPRRCRIQGRAGEAPPRGGYRADHRNARSQSHRRRGSRPVDETRPAVSGRAAHGDAGRAAPVRSHPAAWHRQTQGRCGPGETAGRISSQGRGEQAGPHRGRDGDPAVHAQPDRRGKDSPRRRARSTRWTWTPSPPTVKQEFAAKEKRQRQQEASTETSIKAQQKKAASANPQPTQQLFAEPARSAPHFSCPVRVCPPSLDARERGRPHWPARRARGEALGQCGCIRATLSRRDAHEVEGE